ncbi:MAG TPA: glutamate-cysteine ligase family protein, partial [Gemmatimonadaceae bacterium]|nr:glutamate-cysteine ligase family protein [Gemmatimonadaceae bacterium]
MENPEVAIAIQNELLHDIALLLAVSTSSPFWEGDNTGLASSRVTVFEALPTGGSPQLVHDWNEFCELVETLKKAEAITSLKDLWWDIRPSPRYGTIEIRICDGRATLRETADIVALAQALAKRAGARVAAGQGRSFPPMWRVRENKWRASRFGMDSELVISNDGSHAPARLHLTKTLDELIADGHLDGHSRHVAHLRAIAGGAPTSAERQRAIFAATNSLEAVAKSVADEFEEDVLAGTGAR